MYSTYYFTYYFTTSLLINHSFLSPPQKKSRPNKYPIANDGDSTKLSRVMSIFLYLSVLIVMTKVVFFLVVCISK